MLPFLLLLGLMLPFILFLLQQNTYRLSLADDRSLFTCQPFTGVMHHLDSLDKECQVDVSGTIQPLDRPGYFSTVMDLIPFEQMTCSTSNFTQCESVRLPFHSFTECCSANVEDIRVAWSRFQWMDSYSYGLQVGDAFFNLTVMTGQRISKFHPRDEIAACAYRLDWAPIWFNCKLPQFF